MLLSILLPQKLTTCLTPIKNHSCSFLRNLHTVLHNGYINLHSHQIKLPHGLTIPLLGIYPEEAVMEKDTCTPIFTATLFTIARTWKQPRCPQTDYQIEKLWYIYTMRYYLAIERNTFESVLMRGMNLEPIIQSEVRERKTNIY